jgi:hypothetical protein
MILFVPNAATIKGRLMPRLLAAAIVVLVVTIYTRCTTIAPGANALGVVVYHENPNQYLMASLIDGQVMEDASGRKATSARFQPSFTYQLFDESVLFCGDVSGQINGKRAPLVITYKRRASRKFQGVGCHDLISVDTVESRNP